MVPPPAVTIDVPVTRSIGSVTDRRERVAGQRSTSRRAGPAYSGTDNAASTHRAVPRPRRGAAEILRQFLDGGQPRMARSQRGVVVMEFPHPPSLTQRSPRLPTESSQLLGAERPVLLGHHPRRRTLEDRQLLLRHRRFRVRPALRWHPCRSPPPAYRSGRRLASHWAVCMRSPAKSASPSMSGYLAAPNSPTALTTTSATTVPAVSSSTRQCSASVVPTQPAHARAEHQMAAEVEVVGDRLEVGENLRLIGVGAGPLAGLARTRTNTGGSGCRTPRPDRCSAARYHRHRRRDR